MAKNETRITVTAEDRASRGLKNIEDRLGQLDDAAGGLSGSFGAAQGVVTRFGAALPLGPVGLLVGAVGALGGAAVAASGRLAGLIKEQSNLALMANMTIEDFSGVAYAFETVGFSAEQTSDILKDTNDRLGEFQLTGKGGFADALEAVGASADALKEELIGLSGPDALVAVKKYMDEANLSGEQQTYVMETLANDATKLIGLLGDEGEALRELKGEFDSINTTMNEDSTEAAEKYNRAITGATTRLTNLGNKVLIPLMDIVGDAAIAFNEFWDAVSGNTDRVGEINDEIAAQQIIISNNEKLIEQYSGRRHEAQRQGYERNIQAAKDMIAELEAEKKGLEEVNKAQKLVSSTPIGSTANVANTGEDSTDSTSSTDDAKDPKKCPSVQYTKKCQKEKVKAIKEGEQEATDAALEAAQIQNEAFADMVGNSISNAKDLDDFVSNMYGNMSSSLMDYVGDWVSQQLIMATASQTATTAEGGRKVAEGTASANNAAIKSYESLAGIPIIGPALGFAAAAASWAFSLPLISNIKAAFGGAAHGGLTNVPNEQTYLLQRGERVLSPRQNQDLTNYLAQGGQGGDNVQIVVNASASPEATARAIERALNRRNKRTDRAIARAGQRGANNLGVNYG